MSSMMVKFIVLLLIILTACTPTPDSIPLTTSVDDFIPVVSVTGKLLPVTWANLSTQTGGTITQIFIQEGHQVNTGDILVQLDDLEARNALELAQASLTVAKNQLTQLRRGPSKDEIKVAEAYVAAARTAVSQTLAQRASLDAGSYSVERAAIETQIAALKAERHIINQQHDDAMKCYDVTQPDGSTGEYCPTLGTIEEQLRMKLYAADAALSAAETHLDLLYSQHHAQIEIANRSISNAQAHEKIALAELRLLESPIPPQDIAVASAIVDQAQVAVDSARMAIDRTILRAPFAGIIGSISVHVGEYVVPSTPLLTIGDLSMMRVETTDLDEIDVTQIKLHQNAVVIFEALPDEIFMGSVDYVAPMASVQSGGVNYKVFISLDRTHPKLRWGMTAFVDIETAD